MKIAKLLLGTSLLAAAFQLSAQETDQERECLRMRFLAGEELKIKNYAGASMYYLKGETICGGYDKDNYNRLVGSLRNALATESDKAKKTAYIDTVVGVFDRMEAAGHYEEENDLTRATYIIQTSKPDRTKADFLFDRGIHKTGTSVNESHVIYYYYNLYVVYTETAADKKAELKSKLITEYFFLSKLVSEANMSLKTQETISTYFNALVKSCDDILPDLKGFMGSFSQDKDVKKASVNNFISLLETKGCTDSKEYEMLMDTLISIDPSNIDAVLGKAKLLRSKKKYSESISTLKEAKGLTSDDDKKDEIEYTILEIQYHDQNSYKTAFNTAQGISGKNRSSALKIAAQCVANMANGCGSSTFERKANYLYAAQIADRAGDSSAAAKYRAAGPTESDWFEAGVSSVTLSCWGVTVSK